MTPEENKKNYLKDIKRLLKDRHDLPIGNKDINIEVFALAKLYADLKIEDRRRKVIDK